MDEDYDGAGSGEPTFSISVSTPAGFIPTLVDQGSDSTDSDNHNGVAATVTEGSVNGTYDFGFFDANPDITVTKTANPTSVPETGGSVTFTYVVNNVGPVDASITALTDDKFGTLDGDADCKLGTVLAATSGTCTFQATFTVPAGDYLGSHTNTFSATAVDGNGDADTATEPETVTYTDVLPDITVTKTANPTSVPETGGNVTFTYVVTNNSTEAATITALSDDKFGTLAGDADCKVNTVLAGNGAVVLLPGHLRGAGGDFPGSHVDVFTATADGWRRQQRHCHRRCDGDVHRQVA